MKVSGNMGAVHNVAFVATILSIIFAVIYAFLPFFSSNRETPFGMLAIMVVGLILAVYGGVFMTEPSEPGSLESAAGMTLPDTNEDYHRESYARSRAGGTFIYWFYPNYYGSSVSSSSGSSNITMPKCSGDSCEGLAYLFLILLFIALVLGSLFVPHFWVVGGMIFISLMALTAAREWYLADQFGDLRKSHYADY